MAIGQGVQQLHINVHLVVGFLDAAFENIGNSKLARDLTQVFGSAFVTLSRAARNYFQVRNLRESRDNFVLNASCEVLVVGIAAEISKRQDSNGFRQRFVGRRNFLAKTVATQHEQTDRKQRPSNHDINPGARFRAPFERTIDIFRSFDSLRCDLKCPGQNDRDGKPDDNQQNDQANYPIWNIENRKHLRDSLRKSPTGDDVGDRDFVNIAPLQFGEEVHWQVKASGPRSGVG